MTYINKTTGERYTGGSITRQIDEHTVFSGIPTDALLTEWGFEPYVPPTHIPTEDEIREKRMDDILAELDSMDYLTSKYIDGEDMTEYGDWQAKRKALRVEYRELEAQQQAEEDENEDENEEEPT